MSKGLRRAIINDKDSKPMSTITQKDFEDLIFAAADVTPMENQNDRYVWNNLGAFRYDKLNKRWWHCIDIGVERQCECPMDENNNYKTKGKVTYL